MNLPASSPSPAERLQALLEKRALVERQLKALAARQTASRRKAEARARFLLGGGLLRLAAADPALLKNVLAALPPKEQDLVRSVLVQRSET